jgi:hypothetical protein
MFQPRFSGRATSIRLWKFVSGALSAGQQHGCGLARALAGGTRQLAGQRQRGPGLEHALELVAQAGRLDTRQPGQRLVGRAHAPEGEDLERGILEPAQRPLQRPQLAHHDLVACTLEVHRVDARGLLAQQPLQLAQRRFQLRRRGRDLDDELAAVSSTSAEQAA